MNTLGNSLHSKPNFLVVAALHKTNRMIKNVYFKPRGWAMESDDNPQFLVDVQPFRFICLGFHFADHQRVLSTSYGLCNLFPVVLSSGGHLPTQYCSPVDAYLQIARSDDHVLVACKDMDETLILFLFHLATDSAQTPCRCGRTTSLRISVPNYLGILVRELRDSLWQEKKPSTLRIAVYIKVDSEDPNR